MRLGFIPLRVGIRRCDVIMSAWAWGGMHGDVVFAFSCAGNPVCRSYVALRVFCTSDSLLDIYPEKSDGLVDVVAAMHHA